MSSSPRHGRNPTTDSPQVPATTALLLRLTRELDRRLHRAVHGDEKGIHRARVASRRLREALPVLAAGLKQRPGTQRLVREVTRALGAVREMDVTMRELDQLAGSPDIPRNAVEDVRVYVLDERDRRLQLMQTRLEAVNIRKLNRRLQRIVNELAEAADGSRWRDALAARIGRRSKRLSKAIAEAGHVYTPAKLHAVRLAVKKLRYALELALDADCADARPLIATLKRAQAVLGRLNDLHVIQRHVATLQVAPPPDHTAAGDGLAALDQTLEEECRHLHARYVKQVPALLAAVEEARTVVVAQLAAPAGRKKPLKITRLRDVRHPVERRM